MIELFEQPPVEDIVVMYSTHFLFDDQNEFLFNYADPMPVSTLIISMRIQNVLLLEAV